MNDAVVTEDIGRVRVIKMNRPDALNSMNPWMFMGIRDALHGAQDDDTVAVAVITGEGRAFCAGLDLADRILLTLMRRKKTSFLRCSSLNRISQAVDCCGQRVRRWRWDDDAGALRSRPDG